jgi:hypothetical protein
MGMMKPLKTVPVLGIGLGLLLGACGGGAPAPEQVTTTTDQALANDDQRIAVGGRVFSVPSPVQTVLAIRKAGLSYNKDLALALDRGASLTNRNAQAMALGMYGADLAYATVHNDGQRALATMQVIERLGSELQLGNAFDRTLLERFKGNLGNEDSLLVFTGTAFRAADTYLKENDRVDVSALVLAGGWLQALHLTLSDPAARKDRTLMDRVGDQQVTLDGLVALLEDVEGVGNLLDGFKQLQNHFASITREYTFEEPVTDAAARTTYINSRSSVSIPEEKVQAITADVAAIRAQILS